MFSYRNVAIKIVYSERRMWLRKGFLDLLIRKDCSKFRPFSSLKMFQTGILILTSPIHHILTKVGLYLASAKQVISKRLYIKLEPDLKQVWPQNKLNLSTADHQLFVKLIPAIYAHASVTCSHLDVRVLQTVSKTTNANKKQLSVDPDIILVDDWTKSNDIDLYFKQNFSAECTNIHHLEVADENVPNDAIAKGYINSVVNENSGKLYETTILGGTFDRIHNGHKIFLSAAVMWTKQKLVVGVTDGTMLPKKTLWELIEPIDKRIANLKEFLTDIDPTLSYEIVPIYDPYGPSIEVPEYDCIVVTEETLKGGHKVNEERKKRNMSELKICTVPVLNDAWRNSLEEAKISSSSVRMRLLGTMLQSPQPKPHLNNKPYIIGVTGGIASGKSAIVKHLKELGAAVVDCDRLAHKSYERSTKLYQQLVDEFGKDILHPNGFIDRKVLGAKVFGNDVLRKKLNRLVWPEVIRMADEEIKQHAEKGATVIVKEAALLLEASWDDRVHQVWVCIIPEKEAIKRIQERDNLSEEEALRRINSQISNIERVKKANVVFCSLWEPNYTKSQVNKAWEQLQQFLQSK